MIFLVFPFICLVRAEMQTRLGYSANNNLNEKRPAHFLFHLFRVETISQVNLSKKKKNVVLLKKLLDLYFSYENVSKKYRASS